MVCVCICGGGCVYVCVCGGSGEANHGGHVWKTVLRTVVAVQLQISHTSLVCVREHSDESMTLIDTDVSPLVRNINN